MKPTIKALRAAAPRVEHLVASAGRFRVTQRISTFELIDESAFSS